MSVPDFIEPPTKRAKKRDLVTRNPGSAGIPARPEPSIGTLLAEVIRQGVTTENVETLNALCGLYERVEAKKAERAFAEAFSKLQSEMPRAIATKPVPNKDGTIRYRYAPFEEIMEKVQPFLTRHGFSVSFNSRESEGRITAICTLGHISGHSKVNEFAVRIGNGPPGATETQADRSAMTYAKRGALSDALNIVVDKDDDARLIGKPISDEQARDFKRRVHSCGANEAAFLKYAGAGSYEDIPDTRYDALDTLLKRKEAK